jgi:hypothetical protein
MKTTTIILATLLILQVNSIFASNDGVPVKANRETDFNAVILSAPATPKEATFEEMVPVIKTISLSPITPKEATFEEMAPVIEPINPAPVTPKEASFEDEDLSIICLAPATPAEADFTQLP